MIRWLICSSLAMWAATSALAGAPPSYPRTPNSIRALWVDTWGPGMCSQTECDEMLAYVHKYGFNTILAEIRKIGDAYYPSQIEPRAVNVARGFDPLQYILTKTRATPDMRVEAWMVANRVWTGEEAPPMTNPPHVLTRHPEWILKDIDGATREREGKPSAFLDLSYPKARTYNAQLCADVAKRYPVDAIHLDYIRYPANTWGYGEHALAEFAKAHPGGAQIPSPSDEAFTKWRADQVTATVREIKQAITQARPGIQLSICGLTWGATSEGDYYKTGGYIRAMQDWPRWLEEKSVDFAYFMHYKREMDQIQARDYRQWLSVLLNYRGHGRIVAGQGAYMNSIKDSVKQLETALHQGLDGVAVFSYRTPNSEKIDGKLDPQGFGQALLKSPAWSSTNKVKGKIR